MKQRPIVFTGAEVIATLHSEKTQLRHFVRRARLINDLNQFRQRLKIP